MTPISISAIICTFNRSDYLRKALQSLANQTLPKDQYEIIVVDNCSTDSTKQVVTEEFAHMPNLRYIYEPTLGANNARNTGLSNARGGYIAYQDDDIIASSQWLENILNVFDSIKPQPGCVGGEVAPLWEAPCPAWLPQEMKRFLAMLELSRTPRFLEDEEYLFSANIAFPKHVLESMGGFEVYMGRKGNKLLSMDENLLQERLRKEGHKRYYDPKIAVRHHVPIDRLTQSWFRRRMYWEGASYAIARIHKESLPHDRRWQMALQEIKTILISPRRIGNLIRPTDDPTRFSYKCSTLLSIGYIAGLLGIAK